MILLNLMTTLAKNLQTLETQLTFFQQSKFGFTAAHVSQFIASKRQFFDGQMKVKSEIIQELMVRLLQQ